MTMTILTISFLCFIFGVIIGFGVCKYRTEKIQRIPIDWQPSSLYHRLRDLERLP